MTRELPTMRLAIIVVSWNVRELLRGCLAAILSSTRPPDQEWTVWVVDNASQDGSAAMVAGEFPGVRLLASGQNLGFAAGNNLALRALGFGPHAGPTWPRPDYVLLLNPDTAVAPGAIARMLDFLQTHPRAAGCGAQLFYGDGTFQHGAFRFPDLGQLFFDFYPLHQRLLDSRLNGRYAASLYAAEQPFEIDFALGAALMVRGAAIDTTGLLDEDYFMYCEEVDWCWRMHDAGWSLWCVPAARVTHFEGRSTRQFREEMLLALWRSRLRMYAKRYGALRFCAAKTLIRQGSQAEIARARAQLEPAEAARRVDAWRRVARLARDGSFKDGTWHLR